jgi:integrase
LYIFAVEDFARYFHRSPERLGPEHIRQYQAYLFRERKLSPGTIEGRTAALRFLFIKTLRRPYLPDHIPFPKRQRRLPTILDQQEVARLIDSARNLMHRTMMMMLYATGLRRAEMCHLKVSDIDSTRMVIHVRQGKVGRDHDVLLTPKLLETLREYWRWMKPKTYLFPGTVKGWRADVPITEKIVWHAVSEAAKRAGITKHVSPHSLRHYSVFRTMPSDPGEGYTHARVSRPIPRLSGQSLGIVLLSLQVVEEPKELVSRVIAGELAGQRFRFFKRLLFHRQRGFQIDLSCFDRFVPKPQCNDRAIHAPLQ